MLTDLEDELMVFRGEGWGEGIVRELGMDMHTLLNSKWITSKFLLYSTWNSAQLLCGSLAGRGVWGRMDTCICMAESLHCSPETITTLLTGYTPIQNIKFKRNYTVAEIIGLFFFNSDSSHCILESDPNCISRSSKAGMSPCPIPPQGVTAY